MSAPAQPVRQGFLFESPIGRLQVWYRAGRLLAIDWSDLAMAQEDKIDPHLQTQLGAYFADGAYRFSLDLDLAGTPFQRRVWQALREIPPGTTRGYGELAAQLGSSARAVGNACRANPCAIVVPCHRVVARAGLGGYVGATGGKNLAIKRWLLRHEGVVLD